MDEVGRRLGRAVSFDQLAVGADEQQQRGFELAPVPALRVDQEAFIRARHHEAEMIADGLAETVAVAPAQRRSEIDARLAQDGGIAHERSPETPLIAWLWVARSRAAGKGSSS